MTISMILSNQLYNDRMKILHLTTHLNTGGITSYILGVGEAMTKDGHKISVLSSGGEKEPVFEEAGLKTYVFLLKTKNVLDPRLWSALPRLVRLIKEEDFDLLHAHTRVTQVLASAASKLTRKPMITTAHGYYRRRFGRKLFGGWGKRVVAVSQLVAEELEKSHKLSSSKIRVIFNAIDVPKFKARLLEKNPAALRVEMSLGEKTFVVGCISRLVQDKGHEVLLRAVAQIRKKRPDTVVLIVGDGRERKKLEKLIRSLGLQKNAFILPSEPDITRILSVIDVFAHPATFREGFGLSMLEAMVAKVPIVASNIWAIHSIIRDRVNGFLVEPKNVKALAETLEFVMDHPDLAESFAQNAYQIATQSYSMDRMAREMETVYGEVLA